MDKFGLLYRTLEGKSFRALLRKRHFKSVTCSHHVHSRMFVHNTSVDRSSQQQLQQDVPSSISQFYANKNVFITGGTGFVGKLMIAKLLSSCPDIQGIFCLTRPKKGVESRKRIHEIFSDPVFGPLKAASPGLEFMDKVHAIEGDVAVDDFGMAEEVKEELYSKIEVFVHSAATLSFTEPMRVAVNMNILGTRRATVLARRMSSLKSFVHVSTAYANANRLFKEVKEDMYPQSIEYTDLIDRCSSAPTSWDNDLEDLKGDFPNTYSFTKCLTEHMLRAEARDLPLSICRISVVIASYRDPFPGWIDLGAKSQGLNYILHSYCRGYLRAMRMDKEISVDLIPVDMAAHSIIALGWHGAFFPSDEPRIYHITSSKANPIMWKYIEKAMTGIFTTYPNSKRSKNVAVNWMFSKELAHRLFMYARETLPAYHTDLWRLLTGKKPVIRQQIALMQKRMEPLAHFTTNEMYFDIDNLNMLLNNMTPHDRQEFCCDPAEIDWNRMMFFYCMGIKKYIDMENVDQKLLEEGSKLQWFEIDNRDQGLLKSLSFYN